MINLRKVYCKVSIADLALNLSFLMELDNFQELQKKMDGYFSSEKHIKM